MRRIGIYGGSFDPVHRGHLEPLAEARRNAGLDEVVFVPAFVAPHKQSGNAPAFHRFAMLALALEPYEELRLSDLEIVEGRPVYTVETMRRFRQALAPDEAVLVVGSDSLAALVTWRAWKEIAAENRIVAVHREPWTYAKTRAALPEELARRFAPEEASLAGGAGDATIFWGGNAAVTISSTWVRNAIREGRDPGAVLPPSVVRYLRKHGLYGADPLPPKLSTA